MSDQYQAYGRDKEKIGSDREFGFVFAGFFAIVGGIVLWRDSGLPIAWFGVSAGMIAISFLAPQVLHPFNRVWNKFGHLLGLVTTPIVLGVLFFLVVTPTGLVMRMLGKDPLGLKFGPVSDSYWVKREAPGLNPDSMKRQF